MEEYIWEKHISILLYFREKGNTPKMVLVLISNQWSKLEDKFIAKRNDFKF